MGEKSKKKALEPKNDVAVVGGVADTSIKEKKKKSKKSKADQSPLPESEAVNVPQPKQEHNDDDNKSKKEKKKDGKRKREAADLPAETETTSEVKGVTEADEIEPPKKKKKDSSPDAADKAEKKKKKKKKKDKKDKKKAKDQASSKETQFSGGKDEQDIAKTDQTNDEGKGDAKMREETESKDVDMAEATDAPKSEVKERPWQRARRLKREKKKAEKAEKRLKRMGKNGDEKTEVDEEEERRRREEKKRRKEAKYGPKGKGKKGKKSKASGGPGDAPMSGSNAVPVADLAERWNVQQLDGGAQRQDKFMRLLGGKKQGPANVATAGTGQAKDGARKRLDVGQVSQELEKQFNAGVQLKFGTGGQRRGLGA
jgi:hypothetical protein